MRRWLLPALALLVAVAASGCRTTIGNYFANRLADLGDCVRVEGYAGPGIGARVSAGGLVTTGLGIGAGVVQGGWRYGRLIGELPGPHARLPVVMREKTFIVGTMEHHYGGDIHGLWARGSHMEWFLFPAFNSFVGDVDQWRVWHPFADISEDEMRWARMHAFDWEVSAWFGIGGVTVGFSPLEFVDFVLGWFGVDLAEDDTPLRPLAPDDGYRREPHGDPRSPPPGDDGAEDF